MTELLTVGTMGVLIEAKVLLQFDGGGEGRQACREGEVLCLRACDGNDDSRHGFIGAMVVKCEPSVPLRKGKARVEGV